MDCAADGDLVTPLPGPVRLALPGRGKVHAAPHHLQFSLVATALTSTQAGYGRVNY